MLCVAPAPSAAHRPSCISVRTPTLPLHSGTRSAHGWYPAILGPNNAAAKGRITYSILMLMDVLRTFPGQVGGRGGMGQVAVCELLGASAGSFASLPLCCRMRPPPPHLTTPLPRQIPDVDAVLHTADFTCIPRSWEDAGGGAPLPVIGFQVGWVG